MKKSSAHAGGLGEKFEFHPASRCKPVIPALRGHPWLHSSRPACTTRDPVSKKKSETRNLDINNEKNRSHTNNRSISSVQSLSGDPFPGESRLCFTDHEG